MTDWTLADVCVVACAQAWRGDGEILASPMGTVPTIAARLASLTFEPDLVLSDGEASLLARPIPVGARAEKVVEGWIPYRTVFDVVWSGRRHVMMGANQISRYGDTNISAIGDWSQPKRQLLGARGAPGNTASHPTSYWVPKHSTRVFVEEVDFVSGIGYRRAAEVGGQVERDHDLRRVVTNLAVLDFETPDHAMRVVSLHPGVTLDSVVEATGFELVVEGDVPTTPLPTDADLAIIAELDPKGLRLREVPSP